MLGKLFKHDFRALSRTMRFVIPGILCLALLLTGFVAIEQRQDYGFYQIQAPGQLMNMALIGMSILAGVGMGAAIVLIMVFIYVHYYRSLFSDEGYLTHTLPVKSWEILLAKLLASLVWVIIGYAAITVGLLIILLGATSDKTLFNTELFKNDFNGTLGGTVGSEDGIAALLMLPAGLANICAGLLQVFLAITIGCAIANKHRVWAAIGIYVAISVCTSLLNALVGTPSVIEALFYAENHWGISKVAAQLLDIAKNSAIAVGCFFWSKHLLKRSLNLQ